MPRAGVAAAARDEEEFDGEEDAGEQPYQEGALAQALLASAPRHQQAHEQRRKARAQRRLEHGRHSWAASLMATC